MFIPLSAAVPPLRPACSQITQNDWNVLSRFWYAVALVSEVTDAPIRAQLLDVELVLFRSGPQITAALDRCPHRWVRLSAGKLSDGNLICAFHGLTFAGSGQCIRVPALGDRAAKIPVSYRLRTFRSEVRYGMVWVCLDDESSECVPTYPLLTGYHESALEFAPAYQWPMSAARQIENFVDLAHLPFVHASTLGGDPNARQLPPTIEQREGCLIFRAHYVETVGFDQPTEFEFTYAVYLPFSIEFKTEAAGGLGFQSMNIASPTTAHSCRVFQLIARGTPGEVFENVGAPRSTPEDGPGLINQQDIDMLKQLVIPDLPLTEKLEIHLPVDNVSMAYRERLRELGLGRG
jgi:phenylpropionate dioxygenase-like ring-hydroxylating dioxygenase large terminal subunit